MDYHTDARPTFHGQKIMQVLAPAFPVRVPLPEPPDPCSAAGGGLRGDDVHHRVQLDVLLLYRLRASRDAAASSREESWSTGRGETVRPASAR